MNTVYRLLRRLFAADPFDGEGSFRFGGRWSPPGTRLVYTAEHLSLAIIEYLVNINPGQPPKDLMLAKAEIPDDVSRVQIRIKHLPPEWLRYPAPAILANLGARFVQEAKAAVFIVPSALAVSENNWLLNPAHPDFHRIRIHAAEHFQFDPRLIHADK